MSVRDSLPSVAVAAGEQLVEEVPLRVEGGGPSLVLLPAGLGLSQWDALAPLLAEAFTVIRVSGWHLGMFARLECIHWYPDSIDLMESVFRRLALRDGEAVLDVGSSPGTYVRDLLIENLVLRQQLAVYARQRRRPALRNEEGIWSVIARAQSAS